MVLEVTEENILQAAEIRSKSWKDAHRDFCGEAFVETHTTEQQKEYLEKELLDGKRVYMLEHESAVGIVSIKGNLIENLYILPEEQHKGYGTELLEFAIGQCGEVSTLWVLSNNKKAYSLYTKRGFQTTGNRRMLSDEISEIEMILRE